MLCLSDSAAGGGIGEWLNSKLFVGTEWLPRAAANRLYQFCRTTRVTMRKTVTAGQAIVECLVQHGIRDIFGIPGVHTYSLFDALYERREDIRFVGTRHEQGGAYMAYGYARSTGRIGAYTCVPGPG